MSDFEGRYSKCAAIPGWLIATEVFDFGTKLGVCVWNGKEGAEKVRHAVRTDSFSAAIEQLKEWAEEAA